VRIAPLLGVPGLLTRMGIDPAPLILEAGLDAALFADAENCIAFADAGRLLALGAAYTGCPHFGIVLGQDLGLNALGAVGRLVGSSPDIGSALRNIILYLHLHDRGAIPFLSVSDDLAMLGYVVYQPDVPGTHVIYDLALAMAYKILKELAGSGWEPTGVCLCHPEPAESEPYRRFFRTRPRFRAEHSALVFDASWLDHRLSGANSLMHRQIIREIEALEAKGGGDLATQIRRVLRRMLIGGACQTETCLAQIAEIFAIHRRTLNRRLRAEGTTFKALIEGARYDVARQLLRDTPLSVAEVAAALDYADSSVFGRAFRRWSGISPSAWRGEHAPS
jgi:AraC-like DNA-binding protein